MFNLSGMTTFILSHVLPEKMEASRPAIKEESNQTSSGKMDKREE